MTDRYAEGFAPLLRDATQTLHEAEADAKIAATELRAKESELASLHADIAAFKTAISGSIHATPPRRARARAGSAADAPDAPAGLAPAASPASDAQWRAVVAELFALWDGAREDPRVVAKFLEDLFWKEPRLFERAPDAALAVEQVRARASLRRCCAIRCAAHRSASA